MRIRNIRKEIEWDMKDSWVIGKVNILRLRTGKYGNWNFRAEIKG